MTEVSVIEILQTLKFSCVCVCVVFFLLIFTVIVKINPCNFFKTIYSSPLKDVRPDISKYAGPSDLTGKYQAGPMMFSAYRSES